MFPSLLVIDNFFPNPDKIVEYAKTVTFYPNNGRYPGMRSDGLHVINGDLENYIGKRLVRLFYEIDTQFSYQMTMGFHKISPMHKDQYHPMNRGWVHTDSNVGFGGVIYLNPNPEPDTGTSVFRCTKGYYYRDDATDDVMCRFYRGDEITEEEYEEGFTKNNSNFVETIPVENVYNRMVFFNCDTHHAAQTYGKNQDRLTLDFFGMVTTYDSHPPMFRS